VAPPQVLTIATGLSSTTHTLTIRTAPEAAFAIFDGLVCVLPAFFFYRSTFLLERISSYTSAQAQGDEPTFTSVDIPMSTSSTTPTTASPGPTPSSPNHTKPNIKLIASIVSTVVTTLVGVFGYRKKWHNQIRARLGWIEISVDDNAPTDDNAPMDDQDVPATREHRCEHSRGRGRSRGRSRARSHSGSSSRGLVIPQAQNVSNH
jgi:hypothetical protein